MLADQKAVKLKLSRLCGVSQVPVGVSGCLDFVFFSAKRTHYHHLLETLGVHIVALQKRLCRY